MRARTLIILLAGACALVGVTVGVAGASTPVPLPPQAAQQAVDATATHGLSVQGQIVPAAEAAAAAHLPGAVTEGISPLRVERECANVAGSDC
jgi:hypothetical protein